MPDIIKGKGKIPTSGGGMYVDGGTSKPSVGGSLASAVRGAALVPTKTTPTVSAAIAGAARGGALGKALTESVAARNSGSYSSGGSTYSEPAGSENSKVTDLSDYLRKEQAAKTEAALARLKGNYDNDVLMYDAQSGKLPGLYNAQRNTLAANSAQEQRNFDERAAAAGLNSGTSGQAGLARSALLQRGMAELGQSEADAQAEIDLAKSQLKAKYESDVAAQQAEDEATLYDLLYQEAVRQQNARSGGSSGSYSSGGSSRRSSSTSMTENELAKRASSIIGDSDSNVNRWSGTRAGSIINGVTSGTTKANFSDVKRTVQGRVAAGDTAGAAQVVKNTWYLLDNKQRKELENMGFSVS